MGIMRCIVGRHDWRANKWTGLNAESPIGWRCSFCGATKAKR